MDDDVSCHRYPPLSQRNGRFAFPSTQWYDWCGEFTLGQKQKQFIDTLKSSLSPRARNVLMRLSVVTKNQFLSLTENDYQSLKNCGAKTQHEIQNLQQRIKEEQP